MDGSVEIILGAVLIILGVLRFQVKGVRPFLVCHTATSALVGITYALGGAMSGALVSAGTVTTVGTQAAIGHKIALHWRIILALPAVALAFHLSEGGWAAALPFAAFTLARFAEALQRDLPMRLTFLVCTLMWLGYGWASGLMFIVIFESLGLASNLVGIWRHHLRQVAA
jgi:hypothetical protein